MTQIRIATPLADSLQLIDIHSQRGASCGGISSDIGVYPSDSATTKSDFSMLEFFIECKHKPVGDPFGDNPPKSERKCHPTQAFALERDSDDTRQNRGQLGAYAAAVLGSQFRVHMFSIGIYGDYARFMRWDRGGAVVTERFEYAAAGNTLLSEFISRYSQLKSFERGHDPTITPPIQLPPPDDKTKLEKANPRHREFRRMLIHDRETPDEELAKLDKEHQYIISYPPCYTTYSPFGRATRGMLGYDEEKKMVVYIKDYWRPIASGYEKEGDIYRSLEENKVPYTASFGRGNDLPHQTRSHELCTRSNMIPLQHYRIALNKVGKHLTEFSSTHELVGAIADAMEGPSSLLCLLPVLICATFIAHDQAYFKAKILHRDISVGNILIGADGRGFLIDWDLCIRIGGVGDEGDDEPRRAQRTVKTMASLAGDMLTIC